MKSPSYTWINLHLHTFLLCNNYQSVQEVCFSFTYVIVLSCIKMKYYSVGAYEVQICCRPLVVKWIRKSTFSVRGFGFLSWQRKDTGQLFFHGFSFASSENILIWWWLVTHGLHFHSIFSKWTALCFSLDINKSHHSLSTQMPLMLSRCHSPPPLGSCYLP